MDIEYLPNGTQGEGESLCLRVAIGSYRILLDCGLGDIGVLTDDRPLPADAVLCSHAHPDRARGLLELHRRFPQVPICASEVTAKLLYLNWLADGSVPDFCHGLPWRTPTEVLEGLQVQLFPAGHLPGAAAIVLTDTKGDRPYKLVYTGDFLLSNARLAEGLPLEELRGIEPDVLIIEGNYGTARYPRRRTQENQLAERIDLALREGRSVLLCAPFVGLAQELLVLLRSHHYFTGRDLDIWVENDIAIACDAYLELMPHFPAATRNFARHQSLFWDDRIAPRVRRLWGDPRDRLDGTPAIILATPDADISRYRRDKEPWAILRPARPGIQPRYPNDPAPVRVETYVVSEHCDVSGTTQTIHNLRPQHVVFVGGFPSNLADLANLEELRNRYKIHCPSPGTTLSLTVGEPFLPPEPSNVPYEGELTERDRAITIALPTSITEDPRWDTFADTGLLEIRWQGEELVLRGLAQQELLGREPERPVPPELECCANCLHRRRLHCWNENSPLFGFQVAAEGYCPEFEGLGRSRPRPRQRTIDD